LIDFDLTLHRSKFVCIRSTPTKTQSMSDGQAVALDAIQFPKLLKLEVLANLTLPTMILSETRGL
jgi:hypothetical protein